MRHGFLRFPRNRPIIYLVRHSVIGQLFLPNMFLFRASLVSLVLLQQEVTHRLNLVSKSKKTKTNLSVFSQDSQSQVYEKAWVNQDTGENEAGWLFYQVSQGYDAKDTLKALQKLTRISQNWRAF